MKAADIVNQLRAVLPKITDKFSVTQKVAVMSYQSGLVTATFDEPHGLSSGDYVTITGALSPNLITSLTFAGGVATATTAQPHDLTEGYQSTVSVYGAAAASYNGELPLLTVPNRSKFTYKVPGAPTSPDAGSPYLLEDRLNSYNGRHTISVTGPTTFVYPIQFAPGSPAQGSATVHKGVRVASAASIDRAMAAYTEQEVNDLWAFVVLGDTDVSRERGVLSDASIQLTRTASSRIREIENFSVFVFVPTDDSLLGGDERDTVEDVAVALYKSLVGFTPTTKFSEPRSVCVAPNGNKLFAYDGAVIIHEFMFQITRDIIAQDMVAPDDNVAFRDVRYTTRNSFDELLMDTNIDLDKEPE